MPTTSAPKSLPAKRTQFTVTFDEKEVTVAEEIALKKLGSGISLPGFRAGKAPTDVLRDKVDDGQLLEEVVRSLLSPLLRSLPTEHTLKPILPPKAEVTSLKPLTLQVTFVEHPDVKVKAGKIAVEKKEPKVDTKDVQRMEEYLLRQYQTFTEVQRAAQMGDQVTLDFHGTDTAGTELAGTRAQGYSVVLGAKSLIPGFEEALVGQKAGDATSFPVTFPKDYHSEELRGKEVTFHTKTLKVEEVKKPTFDDAFVKEHSLGTSAKELREKMESSMRAQEESMERQRREGALFEAIADATNVELAPELIEDAARGLLEDIEAGLKEEGRTLADWMEQTKKKPEDLRKELDAQAQKRLKMRFGVEELLKEKKLEATDAEVDVMLAEAMKDLAAGPRAEAETRFRKGSEEYERLRWRRSIEKLTEEMLK